MIQSWSLFYLISVFIINKKFYRLCLHLLKPETYLLRLWSSVILCFLMATLIGLFNWLFHIFLKLKLQVLTPTVFKQKISKLTIPLSALISLHYLNLITLLFSVSFYTEIYLHFYLLQLILFKFCPINILTQWFDLGHSFLRLCCLPALL